MDAPNPLTCPFCNFEDSDLEILLQHVNLIHPEDGDAPYLVKEGQEQPQQIQPMEGAHDWVECPCGEFCLLAEFQDHLDLHDAEDAELDDINTPAVDVAASTSSGVRASLSSMHPTTDDRSRDTPFTTGLSIPSKAFHRERYESSRQSEEALPAKHVMRLSSASSTKTTAARKQPLKAARLGVGSVSLCNS